MWVQIPPLCTVIIMTAICKIISGGQTGADRAGLDFAVYHNIPHGGHCPRGRRALDGRLHNRYNLIETESSNYNERTRANVDNSDATLIFTKFSELQSGSKLTQLFCRRARKPHFHLHPELDCAKIICEFVVWNNVKILNVAGSRESPDNGIYKWTYDLLGHLLPYVVIPTEHTNDSHDSATSSTHIISPPGQTGARSVLLF